LEGDPDVGASAGSVLRACPTSVGVGDCFDDREPEPDAAAAACSVGAAEAFEGVVDERGREAGAVV
jgi:hypothetical protein